MKKISGQIMLIIVISGLFFLGGMIISNLKTDDLSKEYNTGISEEKGIKSNKDNEYMAYKPTEYGPIGTRYIVKEGNANLSCGKSVWVISCNKTECDVEYETKSFIIARDYLTDVKPTTDQCSNSAPKDSGSIPGVRWVGAGLNSIPCGAQVYVNSCNLESCVVIYNNKEYYLPRAELRTAKPTSECSSGGSVITTKKSSSGGLAPVVVPVQEPILTNYIDDYRYVGNYDNPSVGYKLSCGDKVYITTCADDTSEAYCIVTKVNGASISNTKVVRGALRTSNSFAECGAVTRYSLGATFYINSALTIGKSTMTCGDEVTFVKPIEEACLSNEYCEVKYKGDLIYVERAKLGVDKPSSSVCNLEAEETPKDVIEEEDCKTSKPLFKQKSNEEQQLKICYNKKKSKEVAIEENDDEIFTCDKGYHRYKKEVSKHNTCNKASNGEVCSKVFSYSCASVLRPTLEGNGSLVEFNGKGSLTIKGKDSLTNTGLKGYFIYTDQTPTSSSKSIPFTNNNYEVSIPNVNPGTYFVSVMTNDNAISYPLTLSVHDDEITTTADIILASPDKKTNYNVTSLEKGKIGYESNITSSDYVKLSNQLNNDSILASGFDLFTTGYEVTVEADQIAVYATLKSTDASYVEGYGSRTVDLNYGRNVILVKIINNKGRERTYTFIVNRTDTRKNENVLSDLTTSVGKINFDPYVSDYTISVPKNATSVTINGTLSSSTAAFVKGYEPRVVNLDNDITSALIKTISEAGIIRNYILTFVKTGAVMEQNYENSVYLSSLSVHGVEIYFDKENVSYTASVGYEVENLAVYAFPESPNAIVDVRGNIGLQVGPNKLEVLVTNGSLSKMYNIFINRKEDGLQVSSNTKLETLTVKDYDLLFNPDVEDYSIKIKRERTLLLTATPQSDRSEVYMYGNNDLTAYSTIRIKVIAENGDTGLYSVDIIKDLYDKQLETTAAIVGGIIIFGAAIIIIVRKKRKSIKDYIEV
ncbi:MAG: cadherin-like beta sandwich domain-containing protein [Bacilli bacterium]|nr:cadherin-like beta sandwich domain-containing protein [Bacilli bacterium]